MNKFIYIILKNIKNFLFRETRIFIILITGLIISSFALNYLYSYSFAQRKEREQYRTLTLRYEVNISNSLDNLQNLEGFINSIKESNELPDINEIFIKGNINDKNIYGLYNDNSVHRIIYDPYWTCMVNIQI